MTDLEKGSQPTNPTAGTPAKPVTGRPEPSFTIPNPDPELRQYVEKRSKPSTPVRGA
ncbi:MAG TPA: hypothetical protein VNU19_09155 [Candidatus Acidoferrum sp.]|nr:hypothetical protein [Candidatus Acidoferrum sp.]